MSSWKRLEEKKEQSPKINLQYGHVDLEGICGLVLLFTVEL